MKLLPGHKAALRSTIESLSLDEITPPTALRRICAIIGTIADGLPSPIAEAPVPDPDRYGGLGLGSCTWGA